MSDVKILEALQRYTTERPLELPKSAKELSRNLRATLIRASNAKKITTSPEQIHERVLVLDAPPPTVLDQLRARELHQGAFCVVGGEKNQDRDLQRPHFMRNDGSWFDFSIIVREVGDRLDLLAYDFELRLATGMGAPFLRFDLNLPEHRNQDRELRCHLHPGSDDILVPAPLMSPIEVLALFIDGIRPVTTRKPRTLTKFEMTWHRHLLEGLDRE